MAHYFFENVPTKSFTPEQYQIELLNAAKIRNIIACLGQNSSRSFIALKLIQELAPNVRKSKGKDKKFILYVLETKENVPVHTSCLHNLTDLSCGEFVTPATAESDFLALADSVCVLVMTYEVLHEFIFHTSLISSQNVHLLILDECHLAIQPSHCLGKIVQNLFKSKRIPDHILGLTSPLFISGDVHPGKVEAEVKRMELAIYAQAETASEIVSALRYCPKPKKFIVECSSCQSVPEQEAIIKEIEENVADVKAFLEDHRYDPTEIYDEEFLDEIKDIPDPKIDPINILNEFLEVVHTLGLWSADKAALLLYLQIEKLKIKTPYERHYLLLCLVGSLMLKIREIIDNAFTDLSEKERVFQLSSPKILRLIDIVSKFKPKKSKAQLEEELNQLEGVNESPAPNAENDGEEGKENAASDVDEGKEANKSTSNCSKTEDEIKDTCSDNPPTIAEKSNDAFSLDNSSTNQFKCDVDVKNCLDNLEKGESLSSQSNLENGTTPLIPINDGSKSNFSINNTLSSFPNDNKRIINEIHCDIIHEKSVEKSNLEDSFSDVKLSKNNYENFAKDESMCDSDKISFLNCDKIVNNTYQSNGHSDLKNLSDDKATLDISEQLPCDVNLSKLPKEESSNASERIENDCNDLKSTENPETITKQNKVNYTPSFALNQTISSVNQSDVNFDVLNNSNPDFCEALRTEDALSKSDDGNSVSKTETEDPSALSVIKSNDSNETGEQKPLEPNSNLSQNPLPNNNVCDTKNVISNISNVYLYNGVSSGSCSAPNNKWSTRRKGWKYNDTANALKRTNYKLLSLDDVESICGLIFVNKHFTAKILYYLFHELRKYDEDFWWLSPQYTVCKSADPIKEPREAEIEHHKQEEVLKRFRMKDCNILIGTAVLEEGIDLPKCNLVIKFDPPVNYKSYILSRCHARAAESFYLLLIEHRLSHEFVVNVAKYFEIDQMLLNRCANIEPSEEEEKDADSYNDEIGLYQPSSEADAAFVSLNTAITLINRYCAKLPSDTFTRLVPTWSVKHIEYLGQDMFYCTVQLPINSPVKYDIIGHPMPTAVLAKRIAALETCRVLHQSGELDDNLQPIGKESFRLSEGVDFEEPPDEVDQSIPWDSVELRPGTTKRRQYYYKRIAEAFNNCRPIAGATALLYFIDMKLTSPIPEEQNTRGRRLHPPENSPQGFGLLTLKQIPKICSFPIFTRCGEVEVSLRLCPSAVELNTDQVEKIYTFIHYTFTNVLRLQKYLMMFDPEASENAYFIVPTRKVDDLVKIDWEFLDVIVSRENEKPKLIPEEERVNFQFVKENYTDAVVTPWYRNQDQPQYFYAAEICYHLNPKSLFPGSDYKTFKQYYKRKYGIKIQNKEQPLLDVDHTSARLNFLTPRYVNRKGVALPTSSEETKRAKRENLEQKQILVPELCMVHPFPASLWRKAVSLPCILYRINALLLADEIRMLVAKQISLGLEILEPDFEWAPLDFGWRLSDVWKKSREEKLARQLQNSSPETATDAVGKETESKDKSGEEKTSSEEMVEKEKDEKKDEDVENVGDKETDDAEKEKDDDEDGWEMEIGTWTNEMAQDFGLPENVSMIRYGSPTTWLPSQSMDLSDDIDSDNDSSLADSLPDMMQLNASDSEDSEKSRKGFKIEFKNDYLAEALDNNNVEEQQAIKESTWTWEFCDGYDNTAEVEYEIQRFEEATKRNISEIETDGTLVKLNDPIMINRSLFKQHTIIKLSNGTVLIRTKNSEEDKKSIFENVKKVGMCDPESEMVNITESNTDSSDQNVTIDAESVSESESKISNGIKSHFKPKLPFTLNAESGYGMPTGVLINPRDEEIDLDCQQKGSPEPFLQEDWTNSLSSDDESEESSEKSDFSFDLQPDLVNIPGPNPSLLLQALTMSNANDGINLERLETIGDSFLKYAITIYLYCTYENIHEGKLSHLRSKQVSNLNLYRLGKRRVFGESMIATKFEPHDNWLPPCYYVPRELERALIEVGMPASLWNQADLPSLRHLTADEIKSVVQDQLINSMTTSDEISLEKLPCFVPYNLITQHSIPDKSVADCVEALIGAYLIACGPRGALLFMSWLGMKVLPLEEVNLDCDEQNIPTGVGCMKKGDALIRYTSVKMPSSPLLRNVPNVNKELNRLLDGFEVFERNIRYRFVDRSYLLQAMTHASYSPNRLTDCYQRLEFLGDAVLDYLITRHLYEDKHRHSPGALTDLRSALVNNTIFASLAVRYGFHKFFRHLSPGLAEVVERFVKIQEENGHAINDEFYFIEEEECEEVEDVEVPKALGDVFESVAGAVYLDSNMSLDKVWDVYYRMMKSEIEMFSTHVPKSPIRELLELEPETAKFSKPEKLADGRRVRVTVEVFGKGAFKGIGRNYRIAKCTAAKCALKQLKKKGLLSRKINYLSLLTAGG